MGSKVGDIGSFRADDVGVLSGDGGGSGVCGSRRFILLVLLTFVSDAIIVTTGREGPDAVELRAVEDSDASDARVSKSPDSDRTRAFLADELNMTIRRRRKVAE